MRTTARLLTGTALVMATTMLGTHGAYAGVRRENGKEADGEVELGHKVPRGLVGTGVGGSMGPDTTQIAAGAAVLTAAAVGGTLLLHRRASGAQRG
ncbi:hypothetical protein [Streptomyces xantholiticus]|uniref:hypothetical protein n=1 Tax=Streptomyces xantholiticus TaxID=68285 RepID=UPI0016782945|nr:hypothetical protein [Streptomyces xantholiticus]GGW27610.1 hypothetical protein GCM10010381_09890 [Streptomyces xantholiticus]